MSIAYHDTSSKVTTILVELINTDQVARAANLSSRFQEMPKCGIDAWHGEATSRSLKPHAQGGVVGCWGLFCHSITCRAPSCGDSFFSFVGSNSYIGRI